MTEPGHVMTHEEFLRQRIEQHLRTSGGATRQELAEVLCVNTTKVQDELDVLQHAGRVAYVRASRYQVSGRWVLTGSTVPLERVIYR